MNSPKKLRLQLIIVLVSAALITALFFIKSQYEKKESAAKANTFGETPDFNMPAGDAPISIVKLPPGFYKVMETVSVNISDSGQKKIAVNVQAFVNYGGKDEPRGKVWHAVYWIQPEQESTDYLPGDIIERPAGDELRAIGHRPKP